MAQNDPSTRKARRYRLVFVNEREDRNVFSFSMPLWLVAILMLFLGTLTALLAVIIVVRTPLKAYLPGYLDVTTRSEVVEVAMRLDSLEQDNHLRAVYLQDLMATLRDSHGVDTIATYDSAVVRFGDSLLLAASEREQAFRERYEQQERFGIGTLGGVKSHGVTFLGPASGQMQADTLDAARDRMACRILLGREMPVLSPCDGTVVAVDYLMGDGYKVVVQHTGDYLVVLSHLTMSLCEPGRIVRAGTAIGHCGGQADARSRWLGVEVWHKGQSIHPQNVMQL